MSFMAMKTLKHELMMENTRHVCKCLDLIHALRVRKQLP